MRGSSGRFRFAALVVLLVTAAFVGGYVLRGATGKQTSQGEVSPDADSRGTVRSPRVSESSARPARSGEGGSEIAGSADRISLDARVLNAVRMKDPVDRITAFIEELDGLTPENAAEFAESMRKADPKGNRKLEWQALWRRWATLDPAGCVQYIKTLPEEGGHFAIDAVINKWTETDPGAAHDYIASLEGSPLYDTALYSYIGRVGTTDLDAALTMADRALKSRPEEYDRSMQRLHGEFLFANQGGDSREFFKLLKTDEAKNAAFGHVLFRLMNSSPDQAGDWLVEQRSFASEGAIREVERRKNGAKPGSGTEWRNGNFPEATN